MPTSFLGWINTRALLCVELSINGTAASISLAFRGDTIPGYRNVAVRPSARPPCMLFLSLLCIFFEFCWTFLFCFFHCYSRCPYCFCIHTIVINSLIFLFCHFCCWQLVFPFFFFFSLSQRTQRIRMRLWRSCGRCWALAVVERRPGSC